MYVKSTLAHLMYNCTKHLCYKFKITFLIICNKNIERQHYATVEINSNEAHNYICHEVNGETSNPRVSSKRSDISKQLTFKKFPQKMLTKFI